MASRSYYNGGWLFRLFLLLPLAALLMLAWAIHNTPTTTIASTRIRDNGRITSQSTSSTSASIEQQQNQKSPIVPPRKPTNLGKKGNIGIAEIKHRMYIIVGAIRTLHLTQDSILKHVVEPTCPPPHCVAHIVTSLSHSDNRPDVAGNDPRGAVQIRPSQEEATRQRQLTQRWTGTHRRHYPVTPVVDIGSVQERDAMELLEKEVFGNNNTSLRQRWTALRNGDPRRASMWFHRAWAWRTAQFFARKLLTSKDPIRMASYTFLRPDMLWFQPAPTADYLEHNNPPNTLWLHDSWFTHLPDTFAFLSNYATANAYFGLEALVQPGIACLGGPNFDQALVRQRMEQEQRFIIPGDMWCGGQQGRRGWSERILERKLTKWETPKLTLRFLPAGAVLVRGPPMNRLECAPLSMYYRHNLKQEEDAINYFHMEPIFHCQLLTKYSSHNKTLLGNTTFVQSLHPFRFRNKDSCLTVQYGLVKDEQKGTMAHNVQPQPCWTGKNATKDDVHNNNGFQLFAHAPEGKDGRIVTVGCRWDAQQKAVFVLTRLRFDRSHLFKWKPEPTQLYS